MADLRCPMCGKQNPSELDVCQFCGARLKPLLAGSSSQPEDASLRPGETPTPKKTSELEPTLPDWLRSLRQAETSDSSSPEEVDDKSNPPDEEESEKELDSQASTDSGDWLADLREGGEDVPSAPEAEEPDLDWSEPAESSTPEDIPDWLADMRSESAMDESGGDSESEDLEPTSSSEEDEPDWLRRIRERQKSEKDTGPDSQAEEETEYFVPDFAPDSEELDLSEITSGSLDEVPDWLSEAGDASFEESDEASPEELADESAEEPSEAEPAPEIPDWLSEISPSSPGDSEAESAQPAEEVPDWLAELGKTAEPVDQEGEPEYESEQEAEPESGEPVEIFDETVYEAETMPLPDWLASLGKSSQVGEDEAAEDVSLEAGEDELPPYLEELEGEGAAAEGDEKLESVELEGDISAESVAPFTEDEVDESLFAGELPEWLSGLPSQEGEKESEEQEPSPTDSGLEPVNLPGWLEAMRPVEAAAPDIPVQDDTYKQVVGTGPLAGLRGVLPAEGEFARSKKPTGYSVKLQFTDNQQAHAALLEEMVKAEGISRPLPGRPIISSQYLLRLLIFFVLVAAILWPVFTASQSVALPSFSQETFDASNLINKLQSGAPVLLAVDYTPGLSGELDAASGAVLDHLMVRGAYLAIVSTNPTGPAQAERLLHQVNTLYNHQYLDNGQYADLGYIPGGSSGLLGFVEAPQQVLPFTMGGERAWEFRPLQSVKQLANFAMVIVVSDSPENAQAWIEQVQPSLGNTPLVMVVSAQAEPMIRPYYEGEPRQVQGVVSGLSGGASYEGLMVRNGLARKYWDAFSMGIVVAALLIILGGVINAASALISGRKQAEGEGKA
jgi:hypothetical protein